MSKNVREMIRSYLVITAGTLLMAVGIYFFKFPNNFSTGGVSGLSIILTRLLPRFTAAEYMMFFNVALLVLALIVFGKSFAVKTVYSSLLLSAVTRVLEVVIPMSAPFTDEKMLELIFAMAFTAVGSALLFNEAASSGGTDIVAMIIKKYLHIDNIGTALFWSDCILAAAAIFVFDMETGLYSILGLLMKAFVVDNIIENINLSKCFIVVTSHSEEICTYIKTELHRGATVAEAKGSFTNDDKQMIITVLRRGQAVLLKKKIKELDPHGFSVILNSSDILGKGFRTVL